MEGQADPVRVILAANAQVFANRPRTRACVDRACHTRVPVTVLSHAMLLIASFFATPVDVAHVSPDSCHDIAFATDNAVTLATAATPASNEVRVHAFGVMRTHELPSVRVLGRCVVKNGPENAQPVLYVFGSPLDSPDDQDLAEARPEAQRLYGVPTAHGVGPADLPALLASVTQLERPPRV